jgi:hypothetical protein
MDESGRHQEIWRQLHREVIRGLEEELELLRIRESDLQQSAKEREVVLLELIQVERASRLAAGMGAATGGASDEDPGPGNPPLGAAASARAAELLKRLSLHDPRIPELESALRASEEELARMRNRKVFRAVDALVRLKMRLLGRE